MYLKLLRFAPQRSFPASQPHNAALSGFERSSQLEWTQASDVRERCAVGQGGESRNRGPALDPCPGFGRQSWMLLGRRRNPVRRSCRERHMDLVSILVQLVGGAVGGSASGKAIKSADLGALWNSVAGAIGGLDRHPTARQRPRRRRPASHRGPAEKQHRRQVTRRGRPRAHHPNLDRTRNCSVQIRAIQGQSGRVPLSLSRNERRDHVLVGGLLAEGVCS
ncbi:MAG: hypothetical protein K0Q69_2142 [Devosia sp.]|nr:hypothetical protein [Devosia sp.]